MFERKAETATFATDGGECIEGVGPTWVDATAIVVTSSSADALTSDLARAGVIIRRVTGTFGLELNASLEKRSLWAYSADLVVNLRYLIGRRSWTRGA